VVETHTGQQRADILELHPQDSAYYRYSPPLWGVSVICCNMWYMTDLFSNLPLPLNLAELLSAIMDWKD